MILVIGIYKKKNMVIQMNKINITLPIIKINIDYSIRSKEKSGGIGARAITIGCGSGLYRCLLERT